MSRPASIFTAPRVVGLVSFLGANLWAWFWEFIRSLFYERGSHMLSPFIDEVTLDRILHWGPPAIFAGIGLFLFWHTRPRATPAPAEQEQHPLVFQAQFTEMNELREFLSEIGRASCRE